MKNNLIEEKIRKLQNENAAAKNILLNNIKNIDISTYLHKSNTNASSIVGSLVQAKQYVAIADLISKIALNKDNYLRKAISGIKYVYKVTDVVTD